MTSTGLHRFYDTPRCGKTYEKPLVEATFNTGLVQGSKSPTRAPFSDAHSWPRYQNQQGRAAC